MHGFHALQRSSQPGDLSINVPRRVFQPFGSLTPIPGISKGGLQETGALGKRKIGRKRFNLLVAITIDAELGALDAYRWDTVTAPARSGSIGSSATASGLCRGYEAAR